MEGRSKKAYARAWVIAALVVGSAFFYELFFDVPPRLPRSVPELGEPGSTHTHASLLIMIGNRAVDFCDPKYMLKNALAHFENDNCTVIHKHATGVTLPTFLKTLGVELSTRCITIPDDDPADGGERHCNEAGKVLRVVYNGKEVPVEDLSYHELQNNDHILINFGPEEGATLRFKYNQVPMIPLDVNEPAKVL